MSNYTHIIAILCGLLVLIDGKSIDLSATKQPVLEKTENATVTPSVKSTERVGRRLGRSYISEMIDCAVSRNVVCFLHSARDFMAQWKNDLIVQANEEATTAVSRTKDDVQQSIPSRIFSLISTLTTEFTNMFSEGMHLFRTAKEDSSEEGEEEARNSVAERDDSAVEARKKKDGKIKRLVKLIKLIILVAAIVVKICVLVKLFTAALQFKFLLIALAGLVLNAVKFWLDLKKSHHPQKVIYYEHAQHQHHYEHDDDWGHGHGDESYWGRSYDEEEERKKAAQDLAYANQKPGGVVYSRVDDKPNFSWLG